MAAGHSYSRFRFSHQPALSYSGYAFDGEVEDYMTMTSLYGNKWRQWPDTILTGLHTDNTSIIADDWVCNGGQVTEIRWWGNYELYPSKQEKRGLGIGNFLVKIYSSSACLPGSLINTYTVPFSSIQEVYTGALNTEQSRIYRYEYFLPQPFIQIQGSVYWVSIQALPGNPQNPPVWRWQEANRWYYPISCSSATYNPASGWQTVFWTSPSPGQYSDMAFEISSGKSLTISAKLEGLFNSGTGNMNEARNSAGPMWGDGIADKITLELHDASIYSNIIYADTDVCLGTTGLARADIPPVLTGSYYVTIKHRNSIETTSATPLSFAGSGLSYSFDTPAKAYGNNLKQIAAGVYGIYAGDVNTDGVVDALDNTLVDNDAAAFLTGYRVSDYNGDGKVDNADVTGVKTNAKLFARKRVP